MLGGMTAAWPMRGRGRELADVAAMLLRRRGALLAGPSGVGKTSLATALSTHLEDAGWAVLRTVRAARSLASHSAPWPC